ncbi:MAG: MBG domain-containing protein, partial [Bdellovibrionales bacterium]
MNSYDRPRDKGTRDRKGTLLYGCLLFALCPWLSAIPSFADTPAATQLPTGGVVTSGSVNITSSSSVMDVNQSTQKAIINWNTFDVGSQATVNFNQLNASSQTLNRVLSSDASQIFGKINANGQVILINPNGIVFGAGSQVNAAGLVASTMDITNENFQNGIQKFERNGAIGSVVNEGTLKMLPGGQVALIGANVTNKGTITAEGGRVILAAGDKVEVPLTESGLVTIEAIVGGESSAVVHKGTIKAKKVSVVSSGSITTEKGSLIDVSAEGNGDGGTAILFSNKKTTVGGTILAKGGAEGGDGGFVETSSYGTVNIEDTAYINTLAPLGNTGMWLLDPTDYTIASSGGNETGASVTASLLSSNRTITTAGSIYVNDAVSWSSNILTLNATAGDVNIGATMTATGTAGLVLTPSTGVVNCTLSGSGFTGKVNLASGTSLTINGNAYTIINSLGAAGSTTSTDLQGMSGNLAGYYALGSDIDASSTSGWNSGAGFAPVGNSTTPFTGTFNGLGHTVEALYISRSGTNGIGLFGYNGATAVVRNIEMKNANVTGYFSVAGLAGWNYGTISNSYVSGTISSSDDYCGALVGYNFGSVINSYSTGSIIGHGAIGGLVGRNSSAATVSNSYTTASVNGSYSWIGGLVGYNEGTTTYSYSTGSVSGSSYVGGLVGNNNGGTITNSYAIGGVSGTSNNVGGLVGYSSGAISYSYATGNVANAAAAANTGGLVGLLSGGSVTYSYATGNVNCGGVSCGYTGGLIGQKTGSSVLNNSYAIGNVVGYSYVGGLVGWNETTGISNCYAIGSVSGSSYANGLLGYNDGSAITNSYWNTTTSGKATSAGGTGLTSTQMTSSSNFSGFDFTSTWAIVSGSSFPYLQWQGTPGIVRGTTDLANGTTVQAVVNGTAVGSFVLSKYADNSFYGMLPSGTISSGSYVLLYNANGASSANALGAATSSAVTGLTLNASTLTVASATTITTTPFITALGSLSSSDIRYTVSGSTVTLLSNSTFSSSTALTISGDFNWSANTLTATASSGDINISGILTATGTAGLVLTPSTGVVNCALSGSGFTGKVNLASGTSLTINGNAYTIINSLGAAGSTTGTDLQGMSGNLAGYYALGSDIDASATSGWNSGAGFAPVGDVGSYYSGIFNGLGHTIAGLYINRSSTNHVGLFGPASSLSIRNIGIINANITGASFVSGLASWIQTGTIVSNAYVTGQINGTGAGEIIGGLVGDSYGAISNSYSTANITAGVGGSNVGGLVGYCGFASCVISNSYALGNVTAGSGSTSIGGLVGVMNSTAGAVTNSYAVGNVSGSTYVGGLVGRLLGGVVTNSYATGSVSGGASAPVGGFAGANQGTISESYATGNVSSGSSSNIGGFVGYNAAAGVIENSYATGNVSGSTSNVGGFVGVNSGAIRYSYSIGSVTGDYRWAGFAGYNDGTFTSDYWNTTTSGQASGVHTGSGSGVTGLTSSQMTSSSNFSGWDFTNTWAIVAGVSYPYLQWQGTPSIVKGTTSLTSGTTIVAAVDGTLVGSYALSKYADNSFYIMLPQGSLASGSDLLLYQSGGGTSASNAVYVAGGAYATGLTLNSSTLWAGGSTGALSQSVFTTAKGSLSSSDIRFSTSDNDLTITAGVISLNGTMSASSGTYTLTSSSGDITINSTWTLTGTAGLVLSPTGNLLLGNAAKINLASGTSLTISGNAYTIINSLGLAGSTTTTDLQGMNGNLAGYYALGSDIDASATSSWNSGAGFAPVGNETTSFTGIFNGLGHTISGLYINRLTTDAVGLFGAINASSVIRNVGVVNATISGQNYVGSLVGLNVMNSSVTISSCYATGTVNGSADRIGGLVGAHGGGTLSNSYATSNVSGANLVGGLFGGSSYGAVSNSFATGNVSGTMYVGGLTGYNSNNLTTSYSIGRVSGSSAVGGLAGMNTGSIINSYWNTTTSGTSTGIGGGTTTGATGLTSAQMTSSSNFTGFDFTSTWAIVSGTSYPYLLWQGTPTIVKGSTNLTSGATINAVINGASVGPYVLSKGADNSFYIMLPQGSLASGSNLLLYNSGGGSSAANVVYTAGDATATGLTLNSSTLWAAGASNTISSSAFVTALGSLSSSDIRYTVSGTTVTLLSNTTFSSSTALTISGNFNWSANTLTATASSGAINIAGTLTVTGTGALVLTPSTGAVNTINGGKVNLASGTSLTISSHAYTIINSLGAQGSTTTTDLQGMSGNLAGYYALGSDIDASATSTWNSGAGFYSIGVSGAGNGFYGAFNGLGHTIDGLYINRTTSNCWGLFGRTETGATIRNVGVTNANITATYAVGIIAGYNSGLISHSFSTGTLGNGSTMGGIAGANVSGSSIEYSYSTATITGTTYVGGLVGDNHTGISYSYFAGSVSGSGATIGGLAARNYYGGITNCYSSGSVSGSSPVGGLVGDNSGTITDSVWNVTTSGQASGVGTGSSTGVTGLTTSQMKDYDTFSSVWSISQSGTTTGSGNTTWVIYDGNSYPLLKNFLTPLTVTANDATVTYNGSAYSGGNGVAYNPTSPNGSYLLGTQSYIGTSQGAVNVGTYVLTPTGVYSSQQGYDVTYVSGTLTIDPATLMLSITADDQSKTYGTTLTLGTTAFTQVGLQAGDTLTGVTLTSLGAAATANVGTYAIVGSNATGTGLSNYSITYVDGTLTVNAAALTITANDRSKMYGSALTMGTMEYTYTGTLYNSDAITGVTLTSEGSAATANVGTYSITPSAAAGTGLSNYTITYADATTGLTVNAAALTITANDRSKTYGSALTMGTSEYTITSGALYNSDEITGVTLASSGDVATANVGTYSITPSAAAGTGLSNYTITYADATTGLTVNAAALTITANDRSKTYGSALTMGTSEYTITSGALYNSDAITGVTLTSAGSAATANVGTYTITPSAAAGTGLGNYTITYADASTGLTVNAAALTITANDRSKTYGSALTMGTSEYTYTGTLYNSDAITGVTLTSAGSAATANVGTYSITPSAAAGTGLSNYTITYADASTGLTVNAAALTITANDRSKTYGSALTMGTSEYTITSGALYNSDEITGVTLTSAGSAATANVGTYSITPSAAAGTGLSNYTITYADATTGLTVNAAALTITANDR